MHATPFRKRLQSLPLVGRNMDIAEGMKSMFIGDNPNASNTAEEGKKVGGIRGLLRKASVSIKNRQRRHSHALEERPQTAWNRLKTATSFHRHSKFLSVDDQFEFQEELLSPIPGNGTAPPLIPRGYGGAAARATAAAQNEYFARNRQLFLAEEHFEDRESGIGIAVTLADSVEQLHQPVLNEISRRDFIGDLPNELAIQVMESLDHKTLLSTMMVSRRWAEVASSQHVWKKIFIREQSRTYATSEPLALGKGLGLPNSTPETDWMDLYRIRVQLQRNWMQGTAEAVYLSGHVDSIYCVQYDE